MINKDIKTTKKRTNTKPATGKPVYEKREGRPAPEDGKKSGGGAKKSISYNAHGGVCALYRALSKLSVCSRTAAKELILGGRVRVNGTVINDLMYGVCMGKDRIKVDGSEVKEKKHQYIAFNKPAGYETSQRAPGKSAKTIYDLIPFAKANGLNPAGRLDKESRGLILLSNDNNFLNEVSGGDSKLAKFYIVKSNIDLDDEQLEEFASGVVIKGSSGESVKTRPCTIRHLAEKVFEVVLSQDINRQIRKMFEYFGVKVVDLFRYRVGKLKIDEGTEGAYFNIKPEEVSGAPAEGRTKKKV
jgi:23S rRNA pseudouridine2605 synthase